MGSTRLPGKVLKRVNGENPMLFYLINQVKECKQIEKIISKINKKPILLNDIIELFSKEPKLVDINKNNITDEGFTKSLKEDQEFKNS